MDRIKFVLLAFGLSLGLGACADMNMGGHESMEPAAGSTMDDMDEPGMNESAPGDMMDSDDDEGADQ